jgi:ribosome-associated heat shock protein Hsp15
MKAGFIVQLYSAGMGEAAETGPGTARIDRWLFGVRLFKSRSAAADAVAGGKVHVNGERVKPSRGVKVGDTVAFTRGAVVFECVVAAIPLRRGPASEAARCYDETPASQRRREEFAARMKVAAGLTPRPEDRPDKHDRKALRRLRGRS